MREKITEKSEEIEVTNKGVNCNTVPVLWCDAVRALRWTATVPTTPVWYAILIFGCMLSM